MNLLLTKVKAALKAKNTWSWDQRPATLSCEGNQTLVSPFPAFNASIAVSFCCKNDIIILITHQQDHHKNCQYIQNLSAEANPVAHISWWINSTHKVTDFYTIIIIILL